LISPAAYYAARAEGLTVVQSLRNYRLFCANAMLLRAGRVCETCLGKFAPWAGIVHGCYRQSRAGSAVVATMLGVHRAMKTWTRAVDLYFTVTEFARKKFVEGGLPRERIAVKPNFVHPDPGPGTGRGRYAAFVGRLAPEKGLGTLLEAWPRLQGRLPLKIVGDGPLSEKVRAAAQRDPSIEWLGRRSPAELLSIVGEAVCLVVPSIWYETFGRVIAEAFAKGTPVVASQIGAMAELVNDGSTGVHFQAGNPHDLALKVRELLADPIRLARMRVAARRVYERTYTAEHNYRLLLSIYEQAQAARSRRCDREAAAG
jgi:glycosyltransferase involved in cell wall biosynthesis